MFKLIIENGGDVNSKHGDDKTLLHNVAGVGDFVVMETILEVGSAAIEAKDAIGQTPLYMACLWGNHKTVNVLLQHGADPNMGSLPRSWSPLMAAADDGYEECVRLLLKAKANPNLVGPTGSALHCAAIKGHTKVCAMLIDAGADPNHPEDSIPILYSVISSSNERTLELLRLLLERGAEVNAQSSGGTAALMIAGRQVNGLALVEVLLDGGADVGLVDMNGDSALHHALESGVDKAKTVEVLLKRGGNPNQLNSSQTMSSLGYAVPDHKSVDILLQHGANPNHPIRGFTPLMRAAWSKSDDSLDLLLKHGAIVDKRHEKPGDVWDGATAVVFAVQFGTAYAVRALAEEGADLRWKAPSDQEPLLVKASRHETNSFEILSALLEFPTRIDVNATDSFGWGALHFDQMDITIIKRIVNAGADVNLQVDNDDTPLSNAASAGNMEMAACLLKMKADVNLGHRALGSPLIQACRAAKLAMVKLLVEHKAHVNQACEGYACTPLSAACLAYQIEHSDSDRSACAQIIHYLFEHGADVHAQGGLLQHPIIAAAYNAPPDIVTHFLQKGADVNAKDSMGRSPLHTAACRGGAVGFETVLRAGGDIKAKDWHQRTALHWAATSRRSSVVEILLYSGDVDVDAPDVDGWTPLCWAARGTSSWVDDMNTSETPDQLQVIKLLLQRGANQSVVVELNNAKWTPVKIARFFRADEKEFIQVLSNENEGDPNHDLLSEEYNSAKRHRRGGSFCDYCHCVVVGYIYHCKQCFDFDFCFKCYPNRHLVHAPEHDFEKEGQEFEEDPKKHQGTEASAVFPDPSTPEASDDETDNDSSDE